MGVRLGVADSVGGGGDVTVDWPTFLKDFGLPLTMLFGFGWLIVTGRLVPGITHADVKAQRDRALDLVFRMANNIKEIAGPDAKNGERKP